MKIACLQLDPKIGKVEENIHKADEILEKALGIEDVRGKVDILVLPELAFTGYNFDSKAGIRPFLEPTTSGISSQWAQATSRRLACYTIVGYPELAGGYEPSGRVQRQQHIDPFSELPINDEDDDDGGDDGQIQRHSYNACVVTSPEGEVVINYRKTFLYHTDEPWASEGSGFGLVNLNIPPKREPNSETTSRSIKVAIGICMDLNPYRFTAPFTAYEFANHVLATNAELVIVPMAWQASKLDIDYNRVVQFAKAKDDGNLAYWASRLEPLFRDNDDPELIVTEELSVEAGDDGGARVVTPSETDDEAEDVWVNIRRNEREAWGGDACKPQDKVIFVACNRMGLENGVVFAGTTNIMTIEKKDGKRLGNLKRRDALGMAEEALLLVDVDI